MAISARSGDRRERLLIDRGRILTPQVCPPPGQFSIWNSLKLILSMKSPAKSMNPRNTQR